jgi:hypothetical protein
MSSQPATGTPKKAYSVDEFCEQAGGIGRTKTYELIATGQLKARKIAGRTIILETDAQDFLSRLPSATEIGAVRPQPPGAPRERGARTRGRPRIQRRPRPDHVEAAAQVLPDSQK